jgi:hypothetical protein
VTVLIGGVPGTGRASLSTECGSRPASASAGPINEDTTRMRPYRGGVETGRLRHAPLPLGSESPDESEERIQRSGVASYDRAHRRPASLPVPRPAARVSRPGRPLDRSTRPGPDGAELASLTAPGWTVHPSSPPRSRRRARPPNWPRREDRPGSFGPRPSRGPAGRGGNDPDPDRADRDRERGGRSFGSISTR